MPERKSPNKVKLSPLTVAKARPKARAYLIWDVLQAGLAVRVQPSGYSSFVMVYRSRGRPRWFFIGPTNAVSLANARALAAETMLRVLKGEDPAAERRAGRQAATFGVLANRYLEEHAKLRNKSWRQAAHLINRHVLPVWNDIKADSISRSDVRALLSKINGPVLANQILASMSAIFSFGMREEILPHNPCSKIARNKTVSRERVLSDAELPLFWREFTAAGLTGAALQVLLLVGQRPGEITHMRREHIVDGWWVMPGLPDPTIGWLGTKNSQSHQVWLSQPVRDLIAGLNYGDDSGFVFGRPPPLAITMRDICAKLAVPRTVPHDLRRGFSTMVTRCGFDRAALNRVTNHREGGIADIYDRYQYIDENKQIMETVAARLLALAEGRAPESNVVRARF